MIRAASIALALAVLAAQPALAAPDGARLFMLQCKACHQPKTTVMAPTLQGVAGRTIAADPVFKYSAGLKAKKGTWTDANLDAYLKAPTAFATGSLMPTSVPSAENRTAIIAYLKTQN